MHTPLTPIARCQEIAGLAPHEMVVGVSPSEKHERLLAKYRRARRSPTVARAKIVADLRAAVKSGANGDAADLLIVLRRLLALGPDQTEIVQIERRRHAGTEPFSFTINYLPVDIGERIDTAKLHTTPLLLLLERDLKIPITRAEETVEAAPADPAVATQLGIPVLYPVMHITRLMFTTGSRPFEVVETFYRADKFQYRVSMVRINRKGQWSWRPEVDDATTR